MDLSGEESRLKEAPGEGQESADEAEAGRGEEEASPTPRDDMSTGSGGEDSSSSAETTPEQEAMPTSLDDFLLVYKGVLDGPQLRCLQEGPGGVRRVLEGWVSNPEGVLPAKLIEGQDNAPLIAQIDSRWLKKVYCRLWLIEFNPEEDNFAYFAKLYVRCPPDLAPGLAQGVHEDRPIQRDGTDPLTEAQNGQATPEGEKCPDIDRSTVKDNNGDTTESSGQMGPNVANTRPTGAEHTEENHGHGSMTELLQADKNSDIYQTAFKGYVDSLMQKWGVYERPGIRIYKEDTSDPNDTDTAQTSSPVPDTLAHVVSLAVRRWHLVDLHVVSDDITDDTILGYLNAAFGAIFRKGANLDPDLQASLTDVTLPSSIPTDSPSTAQQNQDLTKCKENAPPTNIPEKQGRLSKFRRLLASLGRKKKKTDDFEPTKVAPLNAGTVDDSEASDTANAACIFTALYYLWKSVKAIIATSQHRPPMCKAHRGTML